MDRLLETGHGLLRVARQYTGSASKVTNCQIAVFAAYVSSKGHAFIDRRLYLPSWISAPERRRATHVPEEVRLATKPRVAVAMIELLQTLAMSRTCRRARWSAEALPMTPNR
jgi:SRSO17 transposase